MRLGTITIVALLAGAALSGCIGGDDATAAQRASADESLSSGVTKIADTTGVSVEAMATALIADPANASVPPPTWRAGDAWMFNGWDSNGPTDPATLVVTAASDSTYTMLPTSELLATWDAVFDVSYLGPIRASDLAGAQEGTPVRFFDFPLMDGKGWTTTWDGLEVSLESTFNPAISTPRGPQPGFDIVGVTGDGETFVTYNYVPAVRWWTRVDFREGSGFELTDAKSNWTGTVFRPQGSPLFDIGPSAPVITGSGQAFTIAEAQNALVLTLVGWAQHSARGVLLVDPAGNMVPLPNGDDAAVQPQAHGEFRVEIIEDPMPGEWHIGFLAAYDNQGHYAIAGQQVALEPVVLG